MNRQSRHPNQTVKLAAAVLDLLQEPALLCDEDGRLIDANEPAEALYGSLLAAEEGCSVAEIFEDSKAFESLFHQAEQTTGGIIQAEATVFGKGGESIPASISLRRLPGRGRGKYFLICTSPDTRETRLLHDAREMGKRVEIMGIYTILGNNHIRFKIRSDFP